MDERPTQANARSGSTPQEQPGLSMSRQKLEVAERWLVAAELLSYLRHGVRNKLGSVRNAAYFIRRSIEKSRVPIDPRIPSFFDLINDELRAAENQLASGFGGQRGPAWPRRITPLKECIESALALRALPAGVTVSVQCAGDPALDACAEELVVMIRCLLDNACESIQQGGQIAIDTGLSEDHISLSVSDSGLGFSPDSAEHAVEAFYSTKEGHIGLGLYLAQRILRDHGGHLVIDPVQHGARVIARLPLSPCTQDPGGIGRMNIA